MNKYCIAFLIGVLVLLNSCSYIELLTAEGDIVQYKQEIDTLNKITIEVPCELVLSDSLTDKIWILAYDYLVDGLDMNYSEKHLTIDHQDYDVLQESQLIEVVVPGNQINRITVNNIAKITSCDSLQMGDVVFVMGGNAQYSEIDVSIDCNKLSLYAYCYGNIGTYQFEGKAYEAKYLIEGNISVYAENLECSNIDIIHKSYNDCYVRATEILDVDCYSKGDTYYYGDPELVFTRYDLVDMESTGELIHLSDE